MLNSPETKLLYLMMKVPKCIETINIKEEYLLDADNRRLFRIFNAFYKKFKTIDLEAIDSALKDFNILKCIEILNGELIFENLWRDNLPLYENEIIENYKRYKIDTLTKQLSNKEIKLDEFIKESTALQNIANSEITDPVLTINEIKDEPNEKVLIKSNNKKLDEKIGGFALGQLSVWSGSNGSAKSTYLNQIALESINQGYKVLIYSGELKPDRLLGWIMRQACGRHRLFYWEKKEIYLVPDIEKETIRKWLNENLFIYNNLYSSKISTMINTIRESVRKFKTQVVIIDNLMSLDLSEYGMTPQGRYLAQGDIANKFAKLAQELGIHIHFVCHPRKTTSFLRKTDISGSADLTNAADNVFIMHRVNHDFKEKTQEEFGWKENDIMYSYTNVLEVCKNRDTGTEDYFTGMYFDEPSKRLLDTPNEKRIYKWEETNG